MPFNKKLIRYETNLNNFSDIVKTFVGKNILPVLVTSCTPNQGLIPTFWMCSLPEICQFDLFEKGGNMITGVSWHRLALFEHHSWFQQQLAMHTFSASAIPE